MAKTTRPITTDLFRFVTFRSPEALMYGTQNLGYLFHPDIVNSNIKHCPVPSQDGKDDDRVWKEYLAKLPSFDTKDALRAFNPELFDYANTVHRAKTPVASIDKESAPKVKVLNQEQEIKLFDSLIGEVLSQKSSDIRSAISRMLITNHVLKHGGKRLAELGIKRLNDLRIEIPKEVIACYKPWRFKPCGGSLEGVQSLGVADFRRVEQEVCCYVPGEVSHVENILAKEYKERSTRNFVRTEDTFETESETTIENLTDVTTATRNEISSEIANVIEQEKTNNYGGSLGVSAEYFGAQIDVNAYADFSTSNSSSYSNTQAQTYAEEVTKRALERIVQKTTTRRTSKIIKEFEEANKHGFDNRLGDKHITGIYRWLDIIYKNRLVNYGKRLMVEFMVPEPAEFYKNILKYRPGLSDSSGEDPNAPEAPKTLQEFGINSAADITEALAMNAGSYFGVTLTPLPAGTKTLSMSLNPPGPVNHNRNINSQSLGNITVDADYEADTITGSYTYTYRADSWSSPQQAFCDYTFGGHIVYSGKDYSGQKKTKTVSVNVNINPNLPGMIPVAVSYSGCFGVYGAVTINCVLKASVISDWKSNAYNALLAAYNQKLEAYNQELEALEAEGELQAEEQSGGSSNPAMNRIIEQREIKRICIEMLMKPYCYTQGKDNNTDYNACDLYVIPQVNQTKAFTEYTRVVKFFEQAIDWQIMSYLFYPYYWADKCDWADLMQSESNDLVFQAFLQSGMGRVVVPIREQFTHAFVYYIETGEIWLGNDLVPGAESDLYLSIAEELATIEGTVEEEWETRVPTTLAIVQGKSAFLEEEGLPCCHLVENEDSTNNILGTDDTLQIITPTP